MLDRQCDRPDARREIHQAGPRAPQEPPDHLLGEKLTGRARDERTGPDLEPEVPELRPAKDVRDGLAARTAFDQTMEATLCRSRHLFVRPRRAPERQLEELARLIALVAGPAEVFLRTQD